MSKITILHVSDFHFGKYSDSEYRPVLEACVEDAKSFCKQKDISPSLLIFTGDLVQSGDKISSFDEAKNALIDPLLSAFNLNNNNLLIVPGNHEIARASIDEYTENGLKGSLKNTETVSKFIENFLKEPERHSASMNRLNNYETFFAKTITIPSLLNTKFSKACIKEINGVKVGVALLNTAWRSCGGLHGEEYGKLIMGEKSIDDAYHTLQSQKPDIMIAAFHHPIGWLQEFERSTISSILNNQFDLSLFGHMHEANPAKEITSAGQIVNCQSGCIFESRDHYNSYAIIQIDLESAYVDVYLRTYFNTPHRRFDAAVNVAANGYIRHELKKRNEKTFFVHGFLRATRAAIRNKANAHINIGADRDPNIANDILRTFSCPPLSTRNEYETPLEGRDKESQSQYKTVLTTEKNYLIFGGRETGKTSIAHFLAVNVAEGICDRPRIPVLIEASALKLPMDTILKKALKNYYDEVENLGDLGRILLEQDFIFFVDGLSVTDLKKRKILNDLISQHTNARWVCFTTHENSLPNSSQSIPDALDGFERLHIYSLPRKSIRSLVNSWCYKHGVNGDKTYEAVMNHLNRACLPRTGYVVTLLLYAIKKNMSLDERANEAVLLENIIDLLLNKVAADEGLRDKFDYRAKGILLQEIALKMREDGKLERNSLLSFTIKFLEDRSLKYDASAIIEDFISAGVLFASGDGMRFKYPCFGEYFGACALRENKSAFEAAIQPNQILSFRREIELLSGLERKNEGLIDVLKDIISAGVPEDIKKASPNIVDFNQAKPLQDFSDLKLKTMKNKRMSTGQIDDISDMLDKKISEKKRNENVAEGRGNLDSFCLLLELYGRVIKNSEFALTGNKIQALSLYADFLLRLIGDILILGNELLIEFQKNLKEKNKELTKNQDRLIRDFLNIVVPSGAIRWASEGVVSPKLGELLAKLCKDKSTNVNHKIIYAYFLLELGNQEWFSVWKDLIKEFRNNRYILSLLVELTHTVYMARYLSDEERSQLETIWGLLGESLHANKSAAITMLQKMSLEYREDTGSPDSSEQANSTTDVASN